MPTPKEGYRLKDGRVIPGASTIADYFKDRKGVDSLVGWGYSVGKKAGLQIAEAEAAGIVDFKPRAWKDERDAAGNVGTVIHKMVEDHIRGDPVTCPLPPTEAEAATRAYNAWKEWSAGLGVRYIRVEPLLVSEAKEYGGTPDAIGMVDGKLTLFDWKTGAGIYKSALRQVAAYRNLCDETRPATPIENGAYIVRFDKKTGAFEWHHVSNSELDVAFESFLGFYEEWRRERALEIILERSKSRA